MTGLETVNPEQGYSSPSKSKQEGTGKMSYISSFEIVGKRLFEHLNDLEDRGVIRTVSPQPNETVVLVTDEGEFVFYNRGRKTTEGIRLEGDRPRYALIQ